MIILASAVFYLVELTGPNNQPIDINPATVTKLTDRGSIQTVGIVTDAEPFLRALVSELGRHPQETDA